MNIHVNTTTGGLLRGTIEEILETGEIIVSAGTAGRILCDFLQISHAPVLVLNKGDAVLFVPAASPDEKGVVMGRVGRYVAPDLDHVTIEAHRTLTLKCGDASVVMRHDGKMLSRAQDIAAIASRLHRIKGGSVEIN